MLTNNELLQNDVNTAYGLIGKYVIELHTNLRRDLVEHIASVTISDLNL